MEYYISVDIGGGSIKGTAVSRDSLLPLESPGTLTEPVSSDFSYSRITLAIRFIIDRIMKIFQDRGLCGIGLSIAGLIDNKDFTIVQAPNLPSLDNKNLIREIASDFSCPISILNDSLSFTLGEFSRFDRRTSPFIGITLGTGIGGGLIIDGLPFIGYKGYGFEVGHMNMDPNGPICSCSRRGCLESFCGGFSLIRQYKALCMKSNINTPDDINVHYIAESAYKGQKQALDVFTEMGAYLGRAIGSILNLFNPRMIVLGGKISKAFPLFKVMLFEETELHSYSSNFNDVEIIVSDDSDKSHFIGACLVFKRNELKNFLFY